MSEWTLCHDQVQSALNINQLGGFAMLQFGILEMILLLALSSDKIIWSICFHQMTPCFSVPTLLHQWSHILLINDIRFKALVGNWLSMLWQLKQQN